MIFIVILFIVIFLVGYIFISSKINNFKYRAKQHVLGSVGLGASDLTQAMNVKQEQSALKNFFLEHPNMNEQDVKNVLYSLVLNIINCQNNSYITDKVTTKMNKDKKLVQLRNMNFVRINFLGYRSNKLSAVAVFTDGRDEYNIIISTFMQNDLFYVESYNCMKGSVRGF